MEDIATAETVNFWLSLMGPPSPSTLAQSPLSRIKPRGFLSLPRLICSLAVGPGPWEWGAVGSGRGKPYFPGLHSILTHSSAKSKRKEELGMGPVFCAAAAADALLVGGLGDTVCTWKGSSEV